jgi:hypothetical protein
LRYFYDTEFVEDGRTIGLISIGIVAEDGREFYAVAEEIQTDPELHGRICRHEWLMGNVVPHLPLVVPSLAELAADGDCFKLDLGHPVVLPRADIAELVRIFLLLGGDPELWAWYGAYDHVALAWLWGPMCDLPAGLPMWTNDIKQAQRMLGNPAMPPQPDRAHDALADARWNRDAYQRLAAIAKRARCAL